MDIVSFIVSLGLVGAASYLIKYACDQFEQVADYLGRNMTSGIKGATINAVGSSMPELLTALAFVFTVTQVSVAEGLLASVAVTAGSAVFNALVIPALVILAVTVWGTKSANNSRVRVPSITLDKQVIIRDGVFLLLAELVLIAFLGYTTVTLMSSLVLLAVYAVYIYFLVYQHRQNGSSVEDDDEDETNADDEPKSLFTRIVQLDFINLFYNGDYKSGNRAWQILGLSVAVLAVACHFLAEAVVMSADALGVPIYFTSLILAAAATSVPDTVLSVKDSFKGNYDDAISNVFGSNIFDITVCFGLPVVLFTIMFGAIDLTSVADLGSDVQVLRVMLVGVTVAVLSMFLLPKTGIGKATGFGLLGLYAGWVGWIGISAFS